MGHAVGHAACSSLYNTEDFDMSRENAPLPEKRSAPQDHQQLYDENTQRYEDAESPENQDERTLKFKGRFPRDFYRYSQDFHDREGGAPGIDQDFGTDSGSPARAETFSHLMPEGDGDAETPSDRQIREEIMDALAHNENLDVSDVSARVEAGRVTLSGTVDEEMAKEAIEDLVQFIPGVEQVSNDLIVSA
jgi:hypothetical protein